MLILCAMKHGKGRRLAPSSLFALIALNIIVFLGTHWQKMQAQTPERATSGCNIFCSPACTRN